MDPGYPASPSGQRASNPQLPDGGSESWLTPGRFALVLAVLLAAFFPEVVFAGKSFVFRDFGIFTYPLAWYQRECFWHGTVPLWDPLNDCGIPFLAQWNTLVLYPPSLLYLLLPLTRGLSLFLLLHLFWAGLGMFRLASRWTNHRLAAGLAGVAFVFNGMTLNCLMWTSTLAALAWMPWVVLLAERAGQGTGRRPILLAALAGAMQMLTGSPELILLTWFVVFAVWIGQWVTAEKPRRRLLFRWALIVLFVGLLAAAQLLPFLDLLAHSDRQSTTGAGSWAVPLSGWANLLVPLFDCYRSPLGVYFQPGQDWTSSYYPGIGTLALGLLAVLLVRSPRVWLLAAAAVLGFVLGMGEKGGLYAGLLKVFPPLGFMRYPVKFVFLTTFITPLLAAGALAALDRSSKPPPVSPVRRSAGLALLLVLIIGALVGQARVHPSPFEPWMTVAINGLTRAVFLILILALALAAGRIQSPRLRVITGLLLLVLVWLDVATHAPRQNPTVAASVYQPGLLPQQLHLQLQPGEGRAFLEKQAHDQVYGRMLPDAYRDYLGRRVALLGDCNLLDGLPVVGGFFPVYVREQQTVFLRLFNAATNRFPAGLADFLGVAWISNPDQLSDWQPRSTGLPLCTIGPGPVFVAPSNTPALLLDPDFNPRREVYLPPAAKAFVTATNATPGTVRTVRDTAGRLDFETESAAPALLVLSQTYYHPWQASVDGRPVPLWRANYAFQALEVPAGSHRVELVYRDRRFVLGAILSLVALAGCLAGWCGKGTPDGPGR